MSRCLCLIFIITIISCSSTKKVISSFVPQKGEIAFKSELNIVDKDANQKTVNSLFEKVMLGLERQVRKEKKESLEEINEFEFNQIVELSRQSLEPMFKSLFELSQNTINLHKFQDSLIVSYRMNEQKVVGDYLVINRNTSIGYKLAKKDSVTVVKTNIPMALDKYETVSFEEFRTDKKTIQGLECFKVRVVLNEETNDNDDVFIEVFGKGQTIYEMYVTDRIQSKFHPIFQNRSLLKEYYPLEIVKYINLVPQSKTTYSLLKFSLN